MRINQHGSRKAAEKVPSVKQKPTKVVEAPVAEEEIQEVLPDFVVEAVSKKAERKNRKRQFDFSEVIEANEEE